MAGGPEQKGGRSADQRKARLRALLYLVGAVVAALGVAVLMTRYMDARIAAVRVPTQKVVVSTTDLAIATTLKPEMLTTVDWPTASRPEGTVQDVKLVDGKVVNTAIGKGEPILMSKIASGGTGRSALSTILEPGMRAVSVRVDDVVGVAGFIHPGDHVDVIVTMSGSEIHTTSTSKIILQNIKVLAVGKELDNRKRDPAAAMPVTVATLMVDSEEAEKLALAAARGQLLLALRSGIDSDEVATSGVGPQALLALATRKEPEAQPAAPSPRKRGKPAKVAVRASPPPPPSKSVEVIRGDMFEKRKFEGEAR